MKFNFLFYHKQIGNLKRGIQCWTKGRSSTAIAEDLRPTAKYGSKLLCHISYGFLSYGFGYGRWWKLRLRSNNGGILFYLGQADRIGKVQNVSLCVRFSSPYTRPFNLHSDFWFEKSRFLSKPRNFSGSANPDLFRVFTLKISWVYT